MSPRRAFRPLCLVLFGLLLVLQCGAAGAADATKSAQEIVLKGGVFVNPPFVIKHQDRTFTGMVIDLWDLIDDSLGATATLVEYPSLNALIEGAATGEVDLILTNLFVTHERANSLKFTYPWYDTGLKIMVAAESKASIIEELRRNGRLDTYLIIFFLIASATVALTLFRRRIDPEFPKS